MSRVTLKGVRRGAYFYRASACHSAILLWQIRPSVCPSHCGTLSKRMHTSSKCQTSFHNLVEARLDFLSATAITKYQWSPQRGRQTHRECGNNLRLSIEIAVYLGPWLLWITNRKSRAADRSVSVRATLSDLERQGVRGQNFPAHLHNYARTV